MRVVATLFLAAALAHAPMQCARDPDPNLRREETPAEALYGLAQQFKARGEPAAWRSTLEYLIARYPSDRYSEIARSDLRAGGEPAASSAP